MKCDAPAWYRLTDCVRTQPSHEREQRIPLWPFRNIQKGGNQASHTSEADKKPEHVIFFFLWVTWGLGCRCLLSGGGGSGVIWGLAPIL